MMDTSEKRFEFDIITLEKRFSKWYYDYANLYDYRKRSVP